MRYNDFKENEVYCTRVSHIRCFKKQFPEVDSSKMVSFRVISAPSMESGDLKIDIDAFAGKKYLNPRSECGYWYIEPWHFDDVYRSYSEIANQDPVDWRYFVEFTYEDFPDSHYYLEVSKQDWFANELKKGNYILVSSSTKPYRLARILSAKSSVDAPYGVTASSKRLLSNTSAASAIRKAMHDTRKAEAKTTYLEQTREVSINDLKETINDLTNRINVVEQSANQLKDSATDKINELTKKNAELKDLVCYLEMELQLYKYRDQYNLDRLRNTK